MRANKIFSTLILCTLLAAALPAATVATPIPPDPLDKVEPLVREEIETAGRTDFFVWLTEQADLAPAEHLQTKLEKGRFVYGTLVATAERTQQDLRAALDRQGARYQAFYISNKILVYGGGQALLLQLAARPDVAQVTANHEVQVNTRLTPSAAPDHAETVEPNIAFLNADDVWALGYTGQGVVLADNSWGLDATHPAIAPHYRGCLNPPACTQWDHNYNWWDATGVYPLEPFDPGLGGTFATGMMVGDDGGTNQIGMAPGAQTVHCRALYDGSLATDAMISECLEWDLAPWDLHRANPRPDLAPDVVSLVWIWHPAHYEGEILALQAAGIPVVASGGWFGPACGTVESPGDLRAVLTTGSISHTTPYPGLLSVTSSRGPSSLYPDDYFPEAMAPGEGIRSAWPGGGYAVYTWVNGAPVAHTTGLLGLLWSANPALRGQVALTQQIIQGTAVPLAGQGGSHCGGDYITGPNHDWGYGTVDALAAVQAALALGNDLAYLDGTVRDAATAQPLAGAELTVFDAYGFIWGGAADAMGFYTVSLSPGTFTVTAGAFGYSLATVGGVGVTTGTVTTQDISLTALPTYLISGTVTDAGTGAPLAATISVRGTVIPPVQTDPGTGFYALTVPQGTYTFRASAATYQYQERTVVADHDQAQNFALYPVSSCILIVDDDRDSPDVRLYYTSPLHNLGYDYDVWNVLTAGEPTAADLAGYGIVVWFTGYPWRGAFTAENEAAVGAYLDAGGRFFLSSEDYLHEMGLTPFGQDYLGIITYTNDVNQVDVVGTPGSPIGDGLGPYTMTPHWTWPTFWTDAVTGTQSPFRWQGSGQNNSTDYDGGTFQTVFFGWPLEGLWPDSNARTAILDAVMHWFGVCCVPVANAQFTWTPPAPWIGQVVTFDGSAEGMAPISYTWKLDVGTWKEGAVVTYTYAAAGDYAVAMTATNCAGATATAVHTVTVACPEVTGAAFSWTPDPPAPQEVVTFTGTAQSPRPLTYTWKLDVGSWMEGQVVTHTYDLPGLYTVWMTATNDCGSWQAVTETVAVACPEVADAGFTWTPPAPVEGAPVTFTATASSLRPVTYTWKLDVGSWMEGQVVTHTYDLPGLYTVTLTATNDCGSWQAVTDTLTVTPTCHEASIVSVTMAIAGCEVTFGAELTGDPPFTYLWDLGPFGTYSNTNPVVDFQATGTYTGTLRVWNCGGAGPAAFAFSVEVACEEERHLIYLPLVVR